MTASPGREVDVNLLCGAALGSTLTRAKTEDASRQDLCYFVQTFGRGHQIGIKRI
jgi:hypothetical protein